MSAAAPEAGGTPRAPTPGGVGDRLPRGRTLRLARSLVVAIVALLAGSRVAGLDPLETTEQRLFDGIVRPLLPAVATDPHIVIVDIDDRTLADLGERWPIARATWAQFFRRLAAYGPRLVAADVMFDLPEIDTERAVLDELRQRIVAGAWATTPEAREVTGWIDTIDRRFDADQELAQALGGLGRVTLGLLCTSGRGLLRPPAIASALGPDERPWGDALTQHAAHVMTSHPALALAARSSGAMNVIADDDGTVRRYPYAIAVDDGAWPSLALALALSDTDAATRAALLDRVVAADGGAPMLRFREPTQTWPRVSFSDVMLAPHTEGLARLLHGNVVFVGGTAVGIEDRQRTPTRELAAGVELQATAYENLVLGTWLETRGLAAWLGLLATLVGVGGCAWFLGLRPRVRALVGWIAAALALHLALAVGLAATANGAMVLVPMPLGLAALAAVEASYRSGQTRREQQALVARERLLSAERAVLEGFRRLVEHVGDALVSTDGGHRVRWMNPAAESFFQRRITTGSEVSIGDLVPRLADPAARVAGGVIEAEARVAGVDEPVPVEATAMPMTIGAEVWTNYVIRDTSTRKAAERQKDTFVAAVSHELRTPLTSILGSLRLVTGGVVGEVPPPVRELLDVASQNGERLLVLVNELLDSAKIAAGKLTLDKKPVAVARLVELAAARNAGFAARFGVRLDAPPVPPELGAREVEIDLERIVEVLGNFVSNAVKHTPEGGTVTVAVEPVGQTTVRFSVTDRGPGIRASHLSMLFDRFTRAAPADGRRRPGTGLGLAIAKDLVEAHGGRIGVDTQVGGGSRFWFELTLR